MRLILETWRYILSQLVFPGEQISWSLQDKLSLLMWTVDTDNFLADSNPICKLTEAFSKYKRIKSDSKHNQPSGAIVISENHERKSDF